MIKAILFDWGQTLVDSAQGFRAAEKQAQQRIYQDLAVTEHDAFLQNYRRIRSEHHAQSKLSRVEIWQEVYWYYCRQAEVHKLQQWEEDYWQTVDRHTQVLPEVPSVLQTLAEQFKLGLISNTQAQAGVQAHRLRRFPELIAYFSDVIIAGEGDIPAKPDAGAFKCCLEKLQIRPSEAVYVGDDWRNDICGARDVGIHPVWLKHRSVKRNYPEVTDAVPVIMSLDKLPGLIESDSFSGSSD